MKPAQWIVFTALGCLLSSNVGGQVDSHSYGLADSTAVAGEVDAPTPRSTAELKQSVREMLRGEAKAADHGAWEVAVTKLVDLHDELVRHPANQPGTEVFKWKLNVRNRLLRAHRRLTKRAKSNGKACQIKGNSVPQEAAPAEQPIKINPAPAVVAQRGAVPGRAFRGGRAGFGGPAGGVVAGGAVAGAGGGFAGTPGGDYGETLVNLIERTVTAELWQSAGGPAAIEYYPSRHAIIVTAPAETHDGMADLLRQLRAAGGP